MTRYNEEKTTFKERWFPSIINGRYEPVEFFLRWGRSLLVGSLAFATGCNIISNDYEFSKGVRTGMINKFSHKGLIWKTYEGEMALEGMVSKGNTVGVNVFDFSIDNQKRHDENIDEIRQKIEEAIDKGKKVKITYFQPLTTWPWRSSTSHLIQKVEFIEEK
ncbi:MAG TPA: hypothetical protein VJB94_02900 [Candidatus Nanoarchaeia archaeon]|nr:hypothetical protein [Candidatus Nanoarchaeia archaeon]